ncbi:lysozyme inhibitor LprI family protein [Oscillatoria sp. CS-180]|uniref:lysozyme inhibitor LprI family protein n=1 Tax=Oscillatoria sp. CS-180 TaxID=3021720 RepID=UPI00232F9A84|nr:lysozyme inhibitor LprI family protein [Oscillatoria sp. CS-180]MDB9529188.1 lysozyme inhibitor LprI family protein [Oscillatoria sp. CS-180]
MQGVTRRIGLGLAVGLCLGAIAACQQTTDTAEQPGVSPEPVPEQTTPPEPSAAQSPEEIPEETTSPTASESTTTGQAAPEPEPVPPLPAECSEPQTQALMNQCAKAEYDQADVQLNNAYQAVKASLSEQKEDQLIAAERAWIAYRDAYCEFVQSQFEGGSIQPTIYYSCMERLTSDRTAELQQNKGAAISYEAADEELNAVYQELQTYLDAADQDQLTDAQLAWIDYRNAHCAFESGDDSACLAQVTATRVEQLQEQVESRSL